MFKKKNVNLEEGEWLRESVNNQCHLWEEVNKMTPSCKIIARL